MELKYTDSGNVLILNSEDFQDQGSVLFQPDGLNYYLIYNQVVEIEIQDSIDEELAEFIHIVSNSPVKLLKLDISYQNSFNSKTYEALISYISQMKPNSNLAIDIVTIAHPKKGFSQFIETLENNQNICDLEYYNITNIEWDESVIEDILEDHRNLLFREIRISSKEQHIKIKKDYIFHCEPKQELEKYWPIPDSVRNIIKEFKYSNYKTWKGTKIIKYNFLQTIPEIDEDDSTDADNTTLASYSNSSDSNDKISCYQNLELEPLGDYYR